MAYASLMALTVFSISQFGRPRNSWDGGLLLTGTFTIWPPFVGWADFNFPLYRALFRLGFRRQFAYLQATLWGLITNLFFGALRIAVLLALLGKNHEVSGFSTANAITYTALTQALLSAYSLFGWSEFMRTIHRGEIATDLLRPLDLLLFWGAQDAGRAWGQFILRGLPMLVLFGLLWHAQPPVTPLATVVSVILAWACGFAYRFLVNCAAFWSADAVGIGRFAWAVLGLCCGFLMPLAFFPAWFQHLVALTPFPTMLNSPVELWLGLQTGAQLWKTLAVQLGWTIVMFLLCAWVLRKGLARLEVAGG